jgi:hypothetical protein
MKRRLPALTPFSLFILLFLGGFVLVTALFRWSQATSGGSASSLQVPVINETQKLYLESEGARSTLLFNLAFGTLGALLGLRFAETTRARVEGAAVFAACGLLLISLYSAFLFQTAVSLVLEGTFDDMYGSVLRLPILCQFWSFFLAILLLSFSLFKPARKGAAVLFLCLGAAASPAPAAAEAAHPAAETCARDWAKERSIDLPDRAFADTAVLSAKLREKSDLSLAPQERCEYELAFLDQIRAAAVSQDKVDGPEAGRRIAALLRELAAAAQSPTFTAGELVSRLISWGELWRAPSALVDLQSAGGGSLFVEILGISSPGRHWQGYTRWLVRLPAGKYRINVSRGVQQVEKRDLTVKESDRISLLVGK